MKQILSEEELDQALADLHSDVRTDETKLAAGRVALLTAAGDPATGVAVSRRFSRRRVLVAAAAVLGLVAGGLAVEAVSIGDSKTGNYAAAAGLNAAADRIHSSDPPVGPGQYRYIAQHLWGGLYRTTGESWHSETVIETWVPADPTQEWLERTTRTGQRKHSPRSGVAPTPLAPVRPTQTERRAKCGAFHAGETHCSGAGWWGHPTTAWIAGLPRDPQALLDRLRADAPKPPGNELGDLNLVRQAAEALRSGLLPADLRAAIYRALALIPDLRITDRAANLDGRVGVAYGITHVDEGRNLVMREDIIIDERTGQFIGERASYREGGDWEHTTSMSTAVVDRMGAPPTR